MPLVAAKVGLPAQEGPPVTTIRPRRPEDIDACMPILERVHGLDGYPVVWPADPAAWLNPRNIRAGWVAESTDPAGGEVHRITGHVLLCSAEGEPAARLLHERTGRPIEEMAVISRLFVDPDAQRHSSGRTLMEAAMSYARERGWQLVLGVIADHHGKAVAFYERYGWDRLGVVDFTLANGRVVPMHCYAEPGAVPAEE